LTEVGDSGSAQAGAGSVRRAAGECPFRARLTLAHITVAPRLGKSKKQKDKPGGRSTQLSFDANSSFQAATNEAEFD